MVIWGTIAAVVIVVTLLAMLVERRRGSAGSSRSMDFTAGNRDRSRNDGQINGPMSSGWGGGDGGGGT